MHGSQFATAGCGGRWPARLAARARYVAATITWALRRRRPLAAGAGGRGPGWPGGGEAGGVREPRRPRPTAPAGTMALPTSWRT